MEPEIALLIGAGIALLAGGSTAATLLYIGSRLVSSMESAAEASMALATAQIEGLKQQIAQLEDDAEGAVEAADIVVQQRESEAVSADRAGALSLVKEGS